MAISSQNEFKSQKQPEQGIRTYNAGETLFKEDTQNSELFIVLEGRVGIFQKKYIENRLVGEKMVTVVEKNGITGEMSLFDHSNVSESAKALMPSKVLVINRDQFQNILKKVPVWFQSIIKISVNRLKSVKKRPGKSALRDKKRGVISLIQLLYSVYKKETGSQNALDYEFVLKEAYFVCRLRKKETKRIIDELEKRGLIKIIGGSEQLPASLVIPDIQVLSLYSEYLLLKRQNRTFMEISVPQEEVETLDDIATAAAEVCGETGQIISIDKELFFDKCGKDRKTLEERLIDLKIRSFIDIISGENGSVIVFERKLLDRIRKIRLWMSGFEMETV